MKITIREVKNFLIPCKIKEKKTTNEKIGAFSVIIDNFKATNEILAKAKSLGLSMDSGAYIPTKNESTLAFFFEGKNDVQYVDSALESIVKNLIPRLSAGRDKYTIFTMLRKAAEEKRILRKELGVRGQTLRELFLLKKEVNKLFKQKCSFVDLLSTPKVKKEKPCLANGTYVEVSEHYVQIGTKFLPKNPNDVILMRI